MPPFRTRKKSPSFLRPAWIGLAGIFLLSSQYHKLNLFLFQARDGEWNAKVSSWTVSPSLSPTVAPSWWKKPAMTQTNKKKKKKKKKKKSSNEKDSTKREEAVDLSENTVISHEEEKQDKKKKSEKSTANQKVTDKYKDDDDDEDEEEKWNFMKQQLCPDMSPRLEWAREVFRLALAEATDGPDGTATVATFAKEFYTFAPAPLVLQRKDNVVVFVRIFKAGNNQIRFWMEKTFRGPFAVQQDNGNLQQSLRRRHVTSKPHVCLVTALRDPLGHFASGYNEYEWSSHRQPTPKFLKQAQQIPPYRNLTKGSTERFTQFVVDLLSGKLPVELRRTNWWAIVHVYSMVGVLLPLQSEGLSLNAYLPSLDQLETTWPAFLQDTCPVFRQLNMHETNMTMDTQDGQHDSQKDQEGFYQAAKSVLAQEGPIARALCLLHIYDYACFDKLEIPPLCRNVFAQVAAPALSQRKLKKTSVSQNASP